MPGSLHRVPPGRRCDSHPERLAVMRIQGETDSMGAELHDCCAECGVAMQSAIHAPQGGVCDLCHQPQLELRPYRDPEEGAAGRLYDACGSCRSTAHAYHHERDSDSSGSDAWDALQDDRTRVADMVDEFDDDFQAAGLGDDFDDMPES